MLSKSTAPNPFPPTTKVARYLTFKLIKTLVGAHPLGTPPFVGVPVMGAPLTCAAHLRGTQQPTIFYANHSSHSDTLILLAALPPTIRDITQPAAASDYWSSSTLRKLIASSLLNSLPIQRSNPLNTPPPIRQPHPAPPSIHALAPCISALQAGHNIILFPEGTRHTELTPQPFKSGLFHLATLLPHILLTPTFLSNTPLILPKNSHIPLPLLSTVTFGTPFSLASLPPHISQSKTNFLQYAHHQLCSLHPHPPLRPTASPHYPRQLPPPEGGGLELKGTKPG